MEISEQVKEVKMPSKIEARSRIRELITIVMSSDLTVDEINMLQDDKGSYTGYAEFHISMDNMGLAFENRMKFKKEIFTSMFVDFVSELAIRENMDTFLKEMSSIPLSDYTSVVGNRKHEASGMCIKGNNMVFSFHLSLLQDILVSDFKKKI